MAFTGLDFNNLLDLKTDQAYTGYFSSTKKNQIVREATNKAVEIKVATNDRIQVQDDLFGLFKTNQPFTPTTNEVSLIPLNATGIPDYHHVMNVKAKYEIVFQGVTITSTTLTTPARITVNKDINLRNGEGVIISGVNAGVDGSRFVKRLTNTLFELYDNTYLTIPTVGASTAIAGPTVIARVIYNDASDMKSNRKFSDLNAPDVYAPYYEIANTVMKIYPIDITCSEILVDYIGFPYDSGSNTEAYIDVTDNAIDLLETYSMRFIEFIADETAKLMGLSMRDENLVMQSQGEIMNQP